MAWRLSISDTWKRNLPFTFPASYVRTDAVMFSIAFCPSQNVFLKLQGSEVPGSMLAY